ncbi:MAG: hypothetical protein JXB32_00425 [Deltaproteobacteria bacterium]|nr:hypothetical protein [Deltaproteobacteria bacterium]
MNGTFVAARDGDLTVIADPNGGGAQQTAWTLRDGVWWTAAEVAAGGANLDCDGDGAPDPLAGIRCGTGSGGFPDHGLMLCDGAAPACRAPVAPARVLAEYTMPMCKTIVAKEDEIYALRGSRVEVYRVERDGSLASVRSVSLRRGAQDVAILGNHLLAVDAKGLTVHRLDDGSVVSSVRTCGHARRVFPVGRSRAIVLGLRSVVFVNLADPASPVVVSDTRLVPTRDGITVVSGGTCRRDVEGLDALWDAASPCGPGGRDVAAFEDGLLFVNILGVVHVLDFRGGGTPLLAGSVATGLVREMRAEGGYLFLNTVWDHGVVLGNEEGIGWTVMGSHELDRWVQGTADGAWYSVWWGPGALQIGTRQGSGAR